MLYPLQRLGLRIRRIIRRARNLPSDLNLDGTTGNTKRILPAKYALPTVYHWVFPNRKPGYQGEWLDYDHEMWTFM